MTNVIEQPRRPVADWQQKLDEWLADVQAVIEQARDWAEQQGWATRQDQKRITEEAFGTYEVPVLLIHTPQGRLLLDPIARHIVAAEGRIEFCAMPSYDSEVLIKVKGKWSFVPTAHTPSRLPWSEKSFQQVAHELLKTI